jgi:hypothetical protein
VRTALLALLALFGWGGAAQAQTTTGSVRGYVRGPGNAPLSDVQVALRNVDMGTTRGAVTNPDGFYSIPGLRPGAYELTVRRLGFTAQTRQVQVLIGQTLTLDITMTQAAAQLSGVVVTADAAQTARTSEIGTNVSRQQIRDLPNFERNFLDLAKLAPGMTPSAVNSSDKTFAAGGQPPEAVNVFVDGATYKNDVLRGGVAGQDASKGNPFPQGAVQEFRVITQNYKAEYQKASSAIIVATTRTGGNDWEADAFASGIGKAYVARDAITTRNGGARPDYSRLQAGGSLGGPIVQDRLFFFGTYELNARDEPQDIVLGGDSSAAPAALRSTLSQYLGQRTSDFREHLGFAKLTFQQTSRSTFDQGTTLRHETDFRGFGGQTAFDASENLKVDVYNAVGNWKYAGDRWLNEAQINGQYFTWNPTWSNGNLIGQDYQGLLRIGGKDTEQKFKQTRLSLRNDVTRSGVRALGDHVFKGGASVDVLGYQTDKRFNENPVFRYRRSDDWARPFEAAFGFGDPTITTNNTQFGAYVQDDWTPTPRLVINAGVRWDIETNGKNNDYVTPRPLADSLRAFTNQYLVGRPVLRADGTCCDEVKVNVINELGGIDRYISSGKSSRPAYKGEFQPRLGASYDLTGDGRTVLFGGGGIYYDRNYWNTLIDEQYRRQHAVLTVSFNDVGPTTDCARCVKWDPKYLQQSQLRTLAGSSGLPEVFLVANDLKPPKTYQFSGGVRQTLGDVLVTASYNGLRGYNMLNFVKVTEFGGAGPNYATVFATDDRVRNWYDALQLQLERPLRQGMRWGGSLAYTLARADQKGNTDSGNIFWDFDNHHPTVAEMPRQRAPNNQTHTIIANGIVRLPWDLRLSTIVSLGSGLTTNATDNSVGDQYGQSRTYVYSPPRYPFLRIGHVFNTQDADVRLEKGVRLAAGQSVSLVVDLFNAFGNANYGCYNTTINPLSQAPNENYNTPGCAGLGRRLQLGLRYGLAPVRGQGMSAR